MVDDPEPDEQRVTRTVEAFEDGAHVTLPGEWTGSTVEVVRGRTSGRDRPDYGVEDAAADGNGDANANEDAFAREADREAVTYAGFDVCERLRQCAADPATFAVGLAEDETGPYHATVPRTDLADGLAVLGGDDRASALLSNLAWQAVAGGAGAAVLSRAGPAAARFARALPDERAADLRVVGGAGGRSVNLLDPGVPPSSAVFFDAVDAVTDALTSLLIVVSPQLRDAIREFVMAAHGTHADTSLVQLRELVRYGAVGDDADVPSWVAEESPDLLERVEAVDAEAVGWFLDSLAPYLRAPARSLLSDPEPDVSLVDAVRSRAPLVVPLGDRYDGDTWRAVGRALVHGLWGAAREFVPDDADHPLYVVADEFGPVLDGADHLDRLFARLHRDRVVPAFGVRSPDDLGSEPWDHLAEAVAAGAIYQVDDGTAIERTADLTGLGTEAIASLQPGRFRLAARESDTGRRLLGYPPYPPQRSEDDLPWLR